MALIDIINASFSYGKEDIFNNISFNFNKGEIFCLFGPNGCGKSTLLECIMGFLQLKKGKILLDGIDISKIKQDKIARYISYVPQKHQKSFPYTVLDFVLMGRTPHTSFFSSPNKDDIKKAEEAIKHLGMLKFKDKPYTQLSGGELQLVIIARALAQDTPIIVMDEPSSHLDFRNDLTILETVVDLIKEKRLSILMATHFPNHAFYFENNDVSITVALMNRQKFIATGKPSEVFSEENMKSAFNIESKVVTCQLDHKKTLRQIIPLSTMS